MISHTEGRFIHESNIHETAIPVPCAVQGGHSLHKHNLTYKSILYNTPNEPSNIPTYISTNVLKQTHKHFTKLFITTSILSHLSSALYTFCSFFCIVGLIDPSSIKFVFNLINGMPGDKYAKPPPISSGLTQQMHSRVTTESTEWTRGSMHRLDKVALMVKVPTRLAK